LLSPVLAAGSEYGEDWHVGGQKLTKQHTIDDMLAGAKYLIEHKYTSPAHLAGEGTSAGGDHDRRRYHVESRTLRSDADPGGRLGFDSL
jgi:hypothetical protein